MKLKHAAYAFVVGFAVLSAGVHFPPHPLRAQPFWPGGPPPPMAGPTTRDAQRNAANQVRAQMGWVQNATRTASNYATGSMDVLWQQFQMLRGAYTAFTATLNPRQLNEGANEWADLAAGLDILQESFANYQDDLARGRPAGPALSDLCQVLREGSQLWLQQFNRDCARLRVGW